MNGADEIRADSTHVSVLKIDPCALKAIHLSLDGLGGSVLGALQKKMEHHAHNTRTSGERCRC